MTRINVLILIDKFDYHGSYINGPMRNYRWLYEKIDRDRFNPSLCTLRGAGKSDEYFKKERINVTYMGLAKYDPLTLFKVIRLIREKDIHVLHLTGYGSTTFGRIAGALCGRPAIIHERWVDPYLGRFQCSIERSLSRFTTRAIAISEYARRFLIEKKGIREEIITIIPNGIPFEPFDTLEKNAGLMKRKEFGIPSTSPVVGIIGMMHEIKGHRYFIDAASAVSQRYPEAVFLIIGDGTLRPQLERQVDERNLRNTVRFLGHQDEIPKLLAMMDIYVCASLSETFPVSLLEAMGAGKAVVVTESGGPQEMIRDGVNGIIVPIKDSQALAENILRLIENPSLREKLGQEAGKDCRMYNIDDTVRRIQAVIEEVHAVAIGKPTPVVQKDC